MAYRQGVICKVGTVSYHHTGAQYWVGINGTRRQFDLRGLTGFSGIQERFERFSSVLYGSEFGDAAEQNPQLEQALEVLRTQKEEQWWQAVAYFLTHYFGQQALLKKASQILKKNGFSPEDIDSVLRSRDDAPETVHVSN